MGWEAQLVKGGLATVGKLVDLWLDKGLDPEEEAKLLIQRIRSSDEQREAAGTDQAWADAKEEAIDTQRFPQRTITEPSMPAFTDDVGED